MKRVTGKILDPGAAGTCFRGSENTLEAIQYIHMTEA